jgi:hypothetical protein
MKLKKNYELFQIKQIVIKRTWTKFKEKINWMVALNI